MFWFIATLAITVSGCLWTRRPAHLFVAPFALVGGYLVAYVVTGMFAALFLNLAGHGNPAETATPPWASIGAAGITLAAYVAYCVIARSRSAEGAT